MNELIDKLIKKIEEAPLDDLPRIRSNIAVSEGPNSDRAILYDAIDERLNTVKLVSAIVETSEIHEIS